MNNFDFDFNFNFNEEDFRQAGHVVDDSITTWDNEDTGLDPQYNPQATFYNLDQNGVFEAAFDAGQWTPPDNNGYPFFSTAQDNLINTVQDERNTTQDDFHEPPMQLSQPSEAGQSTSADQPTIPRPTCAKCDRSYASQAALKKHLKRQHSTHSPGRLPCPLCPKSFADMKGLGRHLDSAAHQAKASYTYFCPSKGCINTYTRHDNTVRHIVAAHSELVYEERQGGKRLRDDVQLIKIRN